MRFFSPARSGRPFLAVAAALFAATAAAQATPATGSTPAAPPSAGPAPAAKPGTPATPPAPSAVPATPAAPAAAADDANREAIRREIEKAKQELRDEMRAELQGQQAAKEFLQGAEGEERKLQLLQLNGYLRFRGDLFDHLDLNRGADPLGYSVYPRPLISPEKHGTLTTSNMRLRLEPSVNPSEQIRIHAQIDVLDDIVLGSTPDRLFQRADPTPIPIGSRTQLPPSANVNSDRDSIRVKRVWAEVQTPVGLLAFGRQRAEWGVGILENAGGGIDDDYGDSVDRLQFAIPLRSTPVGPLTIVPLYDLVATGVTAPDPRTGSGQGQPIDAEPSDDAKAIGFKIVRAETDEERKLKLDQGLSSLNLGLYYTYRSQGYTFPAYDTATSPATAQPGAAIGRNATAHVLDFWARWQTKRWRLESEWTGILGEIANASDTNPPYGPILIRQFGGVVQTGFTPGGRLSWGGEAGIASGDSAPGMGNHPERGYAPPHSVDGAQYGPNDFDFRNFRFNNAYRIDLVLWREILGAVTDAWYVKPSMKVDIIEGLSATAAIVYSQAIYASSTPSGVHKPLGLEGDFGLHYRSDDGFIAWLQWGVLQPLDGFLGAGDVSRGHAIRTGLAVKF